LSPERQDEVEDRYGFPLESPDIAARVVMGMALLLAMERHHGNAKKAERDPTLAKISEGTVKGFFPAIEPGRRRRRWPPAGRDGPRMPDWGEIGQTLPSRQVRKA
jgi:hypothetical protein